MEKEEYYKKLHIDVTYSLYEYLCYKSDKTDTSISEIVRNMILEDIENNGPKLINKNVNVQRKGKNQNMENDSMTEENEKPTCRICKKPLTFIPEEQEDDHPYIPLYYCKKCGKRYRFLTVD